MGRVEGKVALITGAARGQGRSHALRLASEGAEIIAIDICKQIDSVQYLMATPEDLAQTVKEVESVGGNIIAIQADVRDMAALKEATDRGVAEFGRLDIVSANAGVCVLGAWDKVDSRAWQDTLDTNLTGVWNTCIATASHLIASGGGSIICTGSTAGMKGLPFLAPYVASKHGVVGIAKTLANELAKYNIRVNILHPTGVNTQMGIALTGVDSLFASEPNLRSIFLNALPIGLIDCEDVSNALLYLASDEARYVTGLEFTVDAGFSIR